MLSLGLFVRLEAKPGKEQEVANFLKQGLELANQERTSIVVRPAPGPVYVCRVRFISR